MESSVWADTHTRAHATHVHMPENLAIHLHQSEDHGAMFSWERGAKGPWGQGAMGARAAHLAFRLHLTKDRGVERCNHPRGVDRPRAHSRCPLLLPARSRVVEVVQRVPKRLQVERLAVRTDGLR